MIGSWLLVRKKEGLCRGQEDPGSAGQPVQDQVQAPDQRTLWIISPVRVAGLLVCAARIRSWRSRGQTRVDVGLKRFRRHCCCGGRHQTAAPDAAEAQLRTGPGEPAAGESHLSGSVCVQAAGRPLEQGGGAAGSGSAESVHSEASPSGRVPSQQLHGPCPNTGTLLPCQLHGGYSQTSTVNRKLRWCTSGVTVHVPVHVRL